MTPIRIGHNPLRNLVNMQIGRITIPICFNWMMLQRACGRLPKQLDGLSVQPHREAIQMIHRQAVRFSLDPIPVALDREVSSPVITQAINQTHPVGRDGVW